MVSLTGATNVDGLRALGLYVEPGLASPAECAELVDAVRRSAKEPATVRAGDR